MNDIRFTVTHVLEFARLWRWWRVVRTVLRGDASGEDCTTYVVRVGEGKSSAELVAAGEYALENSQDLLIGSGGPPRDVSMRLVTVQTLTGKNVATDAEILTAIPSGERQATDEEILAFGARYPDAQRKAAIVGNLAQGVLGRRILFLSAFIRVRYLFVYFGRSPDRWLGCYRVLLAPSDS